MEIHIAKKKTDFIQEKLPILLIKQIIEKYNLGNNIFKNEINSNPKILGKLEHFLKDNIIPKSTIIKFNRFVSFQSTKIKKTWNIGFNDSKKAKLKNKMIFNISIYYLIININKYNHYKIRNYLRLLLFFFLNKEISVNNFFFILEIVLISLIEILKNNLVGQLQLFNTNQEPLLFINDIIETIINFPILMIKDNLFTEKLVNLFKKFFEGIEKVNIILKKDEIWLKLFGNNSIKISFDILNDNSYQKSLKALIDFFKEIYKDNIPKKFYDEIYKKSCIDSLYYINIITFITEFIKNEIIRLKQISLTKGIYLLGNNYIKNHINFSPNEFSIMLSFKILSYNSNVSIFNLNQKEKNIFFLSIKNGSLNIEINNDIKWNTNFKINKKIFYFIIIVYNKKNKILKLYINYDGISEEKIKEKKIEKENINIPKFGKDMDAIIGDSNLYAIFGDIFLINLEFDIKHIKELFDSKGYYSNLIIRNNVKCDLIKNISYSKNFEEIINNFKNLKYEYILVFTTNLYLKRGNNFNNSIIEFNNTNGYIDFFNSKGIEFLTFMLHNFDSIIIDNKLLDIYLSKTLEFLYCILEYQKNPQNDYIIEFDKDNIDNKLNIFFMTFFNILKAGPKNKYFRILSDNIWNSLLKIFSLDFEDSNIYKQIILSILLDYDLFEQKKYITKINDILDKLKVNDINEELLYKIFALDFILESNDIIHKNFLNLLSSVCASHNQSFCKVLINYVLKIENEIKMYFYLRIIYINIKNLKSLIAFDINNLNEFIDKKFELVDHFHCKYCLYVIILCHLLKQEIISDKENDKSDNLTIKSLYYMNNPHNLFIKAFFIENFDLENKEKLKFIISKSKNNYFNPDIFMSLEYHPLELYNIDKFLVRFKSILNYIIYIMGLKQNENIKNVLEYFFNFIFDFSEKLKIGYTKNKYIQKDTNTVLAEFYGSEEFTGFFILYMKFDIKSALEKIKQFINTSFFKYYNPFYLRLLNLKYVTKEENTSNEIKLEIIKYILETINSNKIKEIKKIEIFKNIIIFLISIYKYIYQNEFKKKFSRDFPNSFINLYLFLKDKKLLFSYNIVNLSYLDSEEENNNDNIKSKLVCEIILDIIFRFFFRGNYTIQLIKSLLIETNSNSESSIFYEQDKRKISNNLNIDNEEDNFYDISFCLYFLIYFLEKDLREQEEDKINFISNVLNVILNDIKNLYMNNKKISALFKKIDVNGKNFYIYNNLLDICNRNYRDKNFNINFLQEQYNQIITQYKNEKEKDNNKILINENNNKNKEENKSDSIFEQYLNEDFLNNSRTDINLEEINEIKDFNNNTQNKMETKNCISSFDYLKEELAKINITNIYFKLLAGNNYSKEIIKILFNPKEYYVWNIFSYHFKDYIFFNKKFNKLSKAFKVYSKNLKQINKLYEEDKDTFYLNYPTKIRNYTINEYYRPLLKPYMNFFNSKYTSITHPYIQNKLMNNLDNKEENINFIKYKRIIPELNSERYFCELFKNKGNIFGYIELNDYFLVFKNSPNDDLSSSEDPEKSLPFLFSVKDDKTIDKDKYVLIFYEDIKEIIKRRVCLLYIGLEIFLKNNRSYMFNFFDKKVINKFIREIKIYIQDKNKQDNNQINIKEDSEKQTNKNITISINSNSNLISNINNYNQNESEVNFKLIEDPISEFRKLELQSKNKKGELSNFNYLLLINKYSSRTYNDYN